MAKKIYRTVRTLFHNGELYGEGIEITAEPDELSQALDSGAVVEQAKSAKSKSD